MIQLQENRMLVPWKAVFASFSIVHNRRMDRWTDRPADWTDRVNTLSEKKLTTHTLVFSYRLFIDTWYSGGMPISMDSDGMVHSPGYRQRYGHGVEIG